ncbi:MAG: hypothetical protein QW260_06845 [Thermoproteota archaeon]
MFDIIQLIGAEAAIKIRKNITLENIRGFKRRRKEARVYKRLWYRKWAVYKKIWYEMNRDRNHIFSSEKEI